MLHSLLNTRAITQELLSLLYGNAYQIKSHYKSIVYSGNDLILLLIMDNHIQTIQDNYKADSFFLLAGVKNQVPDLIPL